MAKRIITRRVNTFGFSMCIVWHSHGEFPVAIHGGAMVSSINRAIEGYLNNEHWTLRLDHARV